MIDMIGVGPFITIPLIVSAAGGPQAMLGWIVGAVLRAVRWAGLGRVGRGHARRRRLVSLPEGNLRAANAGSAAVVPLHLAAFVQRAPFGCLRLHRPVALRRISVARTWNASLAAHTLHLALPLVGALEARVVVTPATFVAIAHLCARGFPAISPYHRHRQARGIAVGGRGR